MDKGRRRHADSEDVVRPRNPQAKRLPAAEALAFDKTVE
jgi:hypothetical protein